MSAKGFRNKRFVGGRMTPALPLEKRKLTTGSARTKDNGSQPPPTINLPTVIAK